MSANFINLLSIMHEVILRFKKLADDDLMTVVNCFQRIVNEPEYRRQVWLAMTGKLLVTEMTQDEWVERESNIMDQLGLLNDDIQCLIEQLAKAGKFGVNQYFVPKDLTRQQLIELARKVGIKINSDPHCNGQELPTEAGTLECNLSTIMQPADSSHRPFNLDYDEHEAWVKEQGGDGLTSAEEALWLIILAYKQFGKVPFMGGWIRCRNTHDADESLPVDFHADDGLLVYWDLRSHRYWYSGAVARKFQPLVS